MIVFELIFWGSTLAIMHSYVLFPLILKLFAKEKNQNGELYSEYDNLPVVSVIMAAHNEESVIEEKLRSIFSSNYPIHKIEVLIGTDNCTDKTDVLILNLFKKYDNIFHFPFDHRMGKAKIINKLSTVAKGEIFVLTDANVFFSPDTIFNMVRHFKNKEIGVVGSLIVNTNIKKNGISVQEKTYLESENVIKFREGILWGSMIGAFGGCYSIRKEAYTPVPLNYLMDDFYITLSALEKGYKAINELNSVCYEDVSNEIKEEFRRKIRISIGNFQNLRTFWRLIFPLHKGLSFSFISHKIFRWLTPFFLLLSLVSSVTLAIQGSLLYQFIFLAQAISMLFPLIDVMLRKLNLHIVILRFITHFYSMNLALFIGFLKYIRGVETNVWQPTKRYQ